MKKAIGIYRENILAGKPSSDKNILDLTAEELKKKGFEVKCLSVGDFDLEEEIDMIFTMARGKSINDFLLGKEEEGLMVMNKPGAIRFSFDRKGTCQKLAELNANMPNTRFFKTEALDFKDITQKSIMKPANRHEFWFVITNQEDLLKAKEEYTNENIEEAIIQDFVDGVHVKYYCINNEVILPKNCGTDFSQDIINQIKEQALLSGQATGLNIFGGDFIVTKDKAYCLDVNDWPSFGSIDGITQEEAAIKIADYIEKEYSKHVHS